MSKKHFLTSAAVVLLMLAFSVMPVKAQFSEIFRQAHKTVSALNDTEACHKGQDAGKALKSIQRKYRKNKSLNTTDEAVLKDMIRLVEACSDLNANLSAASYWRDFGAGLVYSSGGLVSTNNQGSVIKDLGDMSADVSVQKLSEADEETVNELADNIESLLRKLGR
ncbi:MAG: hypothetical protein IJ756_00505 [Paludibacteraceae bacterium]|jgi:hypothetical protein|nr:hypothetical protein [Paludibacteraceae bacterium]